MDIRKSTRHQKIIGQFGESLICNWLSRSTFEVSIVDHTGIDIIAYNRKSGKRLGITVKSRTRNVGTERTSVTIFSGKKGKKNARKKVLDACIAFGCDPWIGIYVETADSADVYLTSLDNYDRKYRKGTVNDDWKMGSKNKKLYAMDPNVTYIRIMFDVENSGQLPILK